MLNRVGEALLRWRWLLMTLVALVILVIELVEHHPGGVGDLLDLNMLREILIYGVLFPLLGGLMLDILAHRDRKQIPKICPLSGAADPGVIANQRVAIVESDLLFGAGLASLLAYQSGLDVIGLNPGNEAELIAKIKQVQPDVIILDRATMLTDSSRLLILLRDYVDVRIVVISANNAVATIYQKQDVLITHVTELASVIRGDYTLR